MTEENLLSQVEAFIDDLPPLSPSIAKILELCNSPDASPKDLLSVIQLDPILTGKILQLINSAFYSLPNQVATLDRAIILLGFSTIKNLALSSAVIDTLNVKKSDKLDLEGLWDHCLATAVASKIIAKAAGVSRAEVEEYFIAGLLHDIGRVVIWQGLPEMYEKTLEHSEQNDCDILQAEDETLGTNHCEVGVIISHKWGFPDPLIDVILKHHIECDEMMVGVIQIANQYVKANEFGISVDKNHDIMESAYDAVKIEPEAVNEALTNLEEEIEKAKILLTS